VSHERAGVLAQFRERFLIISNRITTDVRVPSKEKVTGAPDGAERDTSEKRAPD
jgi:hypothetical protein